MVVCIRTECAYQYRMAYVPFVVRPLYRVIMY